MSMDSLTTEDILNSTQTMEVPLTKEQPRPEGAWPKPNAQPGAHPMAGMELTDLPKLNIMVNGDVLPADSPPQGGDIGIREEGQEEEEKYSRRQKPRQSQQKRLDHLTWEKHQAQLEANEQARISHELAQQNSQLQEQLRLKAQEVEVASEKAKLYYEHTLKVNTAAANESLKKAMEEGNTDDYVKYNNIVSENNAKLAAYEIEKNKPNLQPQVQVQQQQSQYQPQNPALQNFLSEHSYLNPNSPAYDYSLHQEAVQIEQDFIKHLKVTNRANVINTPDYYDAIGYAIRARHDPSFVAEPEPQPTYNNRTDPMNDPYQQQRYAPRHANVAPVNRSTYGSPTIDQYQLSPRQKTVAMKAGEVVKRRDGSNYSPYELEKLYKHFQANPLPMINEPDPAEQNYRNSHQNPYGR